MVLTFCCADKHLCLQNTWWYAISLYNVLSPIFIHRCLFPFLTHRPFSPTYNKQMSMLLTMICDLPHWWYWWSSNLNNIHTVSGLVPDMKQPLWQYKNLAGISMYEASVTSTPPWISNHILNKWDEITYLFPNFNEDWEWRNNFILYFTIDVITYPCLHLSGSMLVKGFTSILQHNNVDMYVLFPQLAT